jgi:hypothetical protein
LIFDANPGLRSDAGIASFRAHPVAFNSKWAPEKLIQGGTFVPRNISTYLYKGSGELMFKALVANYGPEHSYTDTSIAFCC